MQVAPTARSAPSVVRDTTTGFVPRADGDTVARFELLDRGGAGEGEPVADEARRHPGVVTDEFGEVTRRDQALHIEDLRPGVVTARDPVGHDARGSDPVRQAPLLEAAGGPDPVGAQQAADVRHAVDGDEVLRGPPVGDRAHREVLVCVVEQCPVVMLQILPVSGLVVVAHDDQERPFVPVASWLPGVRLPIEPADGGDGALRGGRTTVVGRVWPSVGGGWGLLGRLVRVDPSARPGARGAGAQSGAARGERAGE